MDNISVSSSSTVDKNPVYSKKVQMIMTSPDNPMICTTKLEPPPSSTASLKQRGLVSQIAYLPTSSLPEKNQKVSKKQPKTVSSIGNLPGAFVVNKQDEEISKKSCVVNKNKTSFDSPDESPKKAKAYKASKLDHTHDVLKNEVYEDEPIVKKSTYATSNKLSHKFDIFGNQTEEELPSRSAMSYKGNKLEHHYDIFKQFDPLSS